MQVSEKKEKREWQQIMNLIIHFVDILIFNARFETPVRLYYLLASFFLGSKPISARTPESSSEI